MLGSNNFIYNFRRFLDQDPVVLAAMEKFASFAQQAKQDLLKGDFVNFASLMDKNFDTRRSLYGDNVIGETNLHLIYLARSHHMSAKFCGSGGCIVGMYCGPLENKESELWEFRCALRQSGYIFAPIIT